MFAVKALKSFVNVRLKLNSTELRRYYGDTGDRGNLSYPLGIAMPRPKLT